MKKILISLSVVAAVAAVVVGATTAFFSDTETSTGNTFTAGAIDLTIDNSAYSNLELPQGSSWEPKDLVPGDFFFNLSDLKPGDWEEDTISLHVNNNDAWACVDVKLTKNDDVTCTEPELGNDGTCAEPDTDFNDGDLAQNVQFMWWADDGDNVFEDDENIINSGNLGQAPFNQSVSVTLADPDNNIWTGVEDSPLVGTEDYFIGKAFCLGGLNIVDNTYASEDVGGDISTSPDARPVICNGSGVNNASQTDSLMMDISFRVEQSRNNPDFSCQDSG